jgi:hypothetical protein
MEGDPAPTYCADHKKVGMEDIASRRCREQGCKKHPNFGMEGDPAPTYCADHQKEGMENIISRRCSFRFLDGRSCSSYAICHSPFCTKHHPDYIQAVAGVSKVACRFFHVFMDKYPSRGYVQHGHYDTLTKKVTCNEYVVEGFRGNESGRTKVDGYIARTRTIIEFHGDFWHGNPKYYGSSDWNDTTQCTFGELYRRTMLRMQELVSMGYTVQYIWESDFLKWEKTRSFFRDLPIVDVRLPND